MGTNDGRILRRFQRLKALPPTGSGLKLYGKSLLKGEDSPPVIREG
jgi:hypothetical protein